MWGRYLRAWSMKVVPTSFHLAIPLISSVLPNPHTYIGHLDGSKWKSFVSQFGIQTHQLPRLFVLDFPSEVCTCPCVCFLVLNA